MGWCEGGGWGGRVMQEIKGCIELCEGKNGGEVCSCVTEMKPAYL